MYKRRSWQSLVDRLPGLSKTLTLSRACRCPNDEGGGGTSYRTGTYYGFAADLGQLRLRYNRQAIFIDLDRGGGGGEEETINNNNNHHHLKVNNFNTNSSSSSSSSQEEEQQNGPQPSSSTSEAADQAAAAVIDPPSSSPPLSRHTITIAWSQLRKLKRRSAETVEFCFDRTNLPPALASLVSSQLKQQQQLTSSKTKSKRKVKAKEEEGEGSSSTSWSLAVHFAMGVSEDLLAEMRLLGLVRKVRYGWWKLRKCYVPLEQVNSSSTATISITTTKEIFV